MRGVYGNKRASRPAAGGPHVGISLFHTVGDRDDAVKEINTAMVTLVSELLTRMGVDPNVLVVDVAKLADPAHMQRVVAARKTMEASPLYPIWTAILQPAYDEWNKFAIEQSSWGERFATNWETYEHWQERVGELRAAVNSALKEHGQKLASAEPGKLQSSLPGTILDTGGRVVKRVGEGAADAASDTFNLVKYGIYAVLGIAGVIAVTSIVQQVRKDRDPLETYAAIARNRLPASRAMKQLRGA